jgi:O-antigen/teichoic acid export membrane protein
MGAVQRITKNATLLILSDIIGKSITFFYIVIAARYLGVDDFGSLLFAAAFTGIFAVPSDMGLSKLQIREIARDKKCASKITSNVLTLKVLLGVVTFLIIAIAINLMGYPPQVITTVYLIGISVLLNNFGISLESVFQGFEKMEYMAIATVMNSAILLLGALFISSSGGGIIQFAFVYLFSSIVQVVFELIVVIKNFIPLNIDLDIELCKSLLREAFPFALSQVLLVVYLRFDTVLLSILKGETAVGLYGAPSKLVDSLNLIYISITIALFPVTSKLFKYSKEKLMLLFERSLKYLLVLSIPIAVGTTILADKIIELVYGPEYALSVIALQILIWSAALIFINAIMSNMLNSIDKQMLVAKQTAIGAVINFVSNLLLIPSYSYVGASIATLLTQLFSLSYMHLSISKTEFRLPRKEFFVLLSKIVISAIIMAIFTVYLRFMHVLIIIPISTAVYFVSFYLLGGIDKDDIEIVKQLTIGLLHPS